MKPNFNPKMQNKHGLIEVGTKVVFDVENPSQWIGPNSGILAFDGADFYIDTDVGAVTINKGYDAYLNTIRPISDKPEVRE